MGNSLEEDYRDFIQIQGLKGEIDVTKVSAELGVGEEELFEFVNERVVRLGEGELDPQKLGESLGTLFLFGYWLRGVRGNEKES